MTICYFTATVIATAYGQNGRADACTLAFYMVSSHVPPCVTIAINATQKRKTLQSILASQTFTVGFPSTAQIKEADYLGVESGYNTDKLKNIGFTVTKARTVHAPIINELPLTLECKLVHSVTVGSHTQLTGEVKNILAEENILNENNRILLEKMQPIIYDEEEFAYFGIGQRMSDAFKVGAALKKSLNAAENN
ncbi:MAG: flavin reductase family protein [bacterium]|nr:flavin reductase family protein [bacterium]